MDQVRRYDAFISYRRSDGTRVARWLRHKLQTYRPPRSLQKSYRRLNVYLDTSYETATTDFYVDTIVPALAASDRLIVVATPDALLARRDGQRKWVAREISDFRELPLGNRIIVAIGGDMPDDRLPADLDVTFPQVERVDLRPAGRPQPPWGFAARARLHDEFLKIAAPLWGVSTHEMPLLREEEARRRIRNLSIVLASALTLLVVMTALVLWGTVNLASARRQLAANHLAQGQNLVDRAPVDARLHLVRALEIAEQSRLPWLRFPDHAAAARSWLGVHFREPVTQILRHPAPVQWVRFAPHSVKLATGADDGVLRLWTEGKLDASSPPQGAPITWLAFDKKGERVAFATDLPKRRIAIWDPRASRVTHVIDGELMFPQYGPEHDEVIAIAESENRLRVWQIDSGFRGPPIEVDLKQTLKFTPTADYAAITGEGTLTLWEIASGRKITELPFAPVNTALAFSGDGRRLIVPVGERAVRVFDTRTGRPLSAPMEVSKLVAYAALDREGLRAAVVWHADDKVSPEEHFEWVSIRDVATGKHIMPPQQVDALITAPRFLGRDALLTVDRAQVRRWSVTTGLVAARHVAIAQPIASAIDDTHRSIGITTASGAVEILDAVSLQRTRAPLQHAQGFPIVRFDRDGATALSFGAADCTVRIARARRRSSLTVLRPAASVDDFNLRKAISAAAVSADGRSVAAADGEGVDFWVDGRGPKRILDCVATEVVFAPTGMLAAGCRDRGVWLFDAIGGMARRLPGTREIACLSFTPDGRRLVTCERGKVWLRNVDSGVLAMPALLHPPGVRNAEVSPDGRWLATVAEDHTTIIHDLRSGRAHSPRLRTYAAFDVAFSGDSRMLATAGAPARVWDVPHGRAVTKELPNANAVRTVYFSPDGARLLTGGLDGIAQLWDIRTSRPDGPPLIDRGAIWDAGVSPDGARIVTGTFDHRVTLWDSRSKRAIVPPLPLRGSVIVARFDDGGRRVLIGTLFGGLYLWDVSPADATPAALRLIAEQDSGRTIDEETGLVRVTGTGSVSTIRPR